MTTLKTLLAAAALIGLAAAPALAANFDVKLLNKGSDGGAMVFEPSLTKVAVGDTVTFIATDKTHNSESIAKAIPPGAQGWKGKINQEVSVTFDVAGFYGYKCLPHVGMGMVGLIQVGDAGSPDPALAGTVPGKGKARMAELIAQAQGQ